MDNPNVSRLSKSLEHRAKLKLEADVLQPIKTLVQLEPCVNLRISKEAKEKLLDELDRPDPHMIGLLNVVHQIMVDLLTPCRAEREEALFITEVYNLVNEGKLTPIWEKGEHPHEPTETSDGVSCGPVQQSPL